MPYKTEKQPTRSSDARKVIGALITIAAFLALCALLPNGGHL